MTAAGAATTQRQPADNRNILPRSDRAAAITAARGRSEQIEFRLFFNFKIKLLPRRRRPCFIKHDRQAVDNDIEKTADQQTE